MDLEMLVQMAFVLILTLVIGGFVIVFPIARRLGSVMEEWLRDRKELRAERPAILALHEEIGETRDLFASHEARLDEIVEHQRFLDSLVGKSPGGQLAGGTSEPSDPPRLKGDPAT